MSHTVRHKEKRVWVDRRPRVYRSKFRCVAKRCFPDEVSARAAGVLSIEERGGVKQLWTYKCPRCSRWHLTKKNLGTRFSVMPLANDKKNEPSPSADLRG